jgi:tetratricopeptide (TPR) repeat protein
MQKLRLLLRSAERLTLYGRHQPAFELYQKVLKEYPDYPDPLSIYQKLLPLAKKLDQKEEVERCEREIKRLSPPPAKP